MPSKGDLGPILLLGGEGFFGSFITTTLLSRHPTTEIHIAGLRQPATPTPNTTSHYLDLSSPSPSPITALLEKTKPRLIFHLASPLPGARKAAFYACNEHGTKNLLECARESPFVEALVLTSSEQAIANLDYTKLLSEESAEIWADEKHVSRKTDPYSRTKAIADRLVQEANSPDLRTVVLRFPNVYGGTDAYMSIIMEDLEKGRTNVRLGRSKATWEFVSIESAATAHVLAAEAVLAREPESREKVSGQVFHISDDHPETWYSFAERAWRFAGDTTDYEKVTVVPLWVVVAAAWVWEVVLLVFTFGYVEPGRFFVGNVRKFETGMHRLDVGKARRVLGFRPLLGKEERDEALKRAVGRAIEHRDRKAGLKNKKNV